jgi:hypothetical protein
MITKRLPGRSFLVAIIIIMVMITPVVAVMAQEWISSEEPGFNEYVGTYDSQVIGDSPDENGFTGQVFLGEGIIEPSEQSESFDAQLMVDGPDQNGFTGPVLQTEVITESSEIVELFDPEQFHQEGEPQQDDTDFYDGISINNEVSWSDFYYLYAGGSTLRPRASATTWSYNGVGCVSAVTGNDIFSLDLQLPQGARIDYLRLYYYDTSANNSTAWITTYDGSGGFTDLTSVSSTGNSGYGTSLSPLVEHVVNNATRAYVFNWRADQTGSTMRLCAFRVAYRLP